VPNSEQIWQPGETHNQLLSLAQRRHWHPQDPSGYTLSSVRTGAPVARPKSIPPDDQFEVRWWRRDAWGLVGPFGVDLSLDDALKFIAPVARMLIEPRLISQCQCSPSTRTSRSAAEWDMCKLSMTTMASPLCEWMNSPGQLSR